MVSWAHSRPFPWVGRSGLVVARLIVCGRWDTWDFCRVQALTWGRPGQDVQRPGSLCRGVFFRLFCVTLSRLDLYFVMFRTAAVSTPGGSQTPWCQSLQGQFQDKVENTQSQTARTLP